MQQLHLKYLIKTNKISLVFSAEHEKMFFPKNIRITNIGHNNSSTTVDIGI